MRAKEFLIDAKDLQIDLEIEDILDKDGLPSLDDNPMFIPPLQQTLEVEKARVNPDLIKSDPIIRKLVRKFTTNRSPNIPK